MASKHLAEARRVFDVELAAVRAVKQALDVRFDRVVEVLVRDARTSRQDRSWWASANPAPSGEKSPPH